MTGNHSEVIARFQRWTDSVDVPRHRSSLPWRRHRLCGDSDSDLADVTPAPTKLDSRTSRNPSATSAGSGSDGNHPSPISASRAALSGVMPIRARSGFGRAAGRQYTPAERDRRRIERGRELGPECATPRIVSADRDSALRRALRGPRTPSAASRHHAERDAPVRELIDRRQLVGKQDRRPQRHDQNTSADAGPLGSRTAIAAINDSVSGHGSCG